MLPIDLLIDEHKLIKQMVEWMERELATIRESKKADSRSVDFMIDFFRMYTDRCHHGKEEGILFRDLAKKQLSPEHAETMTELVGDHDFARRTVKNLEYTNERYIVNKPGSLNDIMHLIHILVEFYPSHITKENASFFVPCMGYLTRQEQDSMLQEFQDYDGKLIHAKYTEAVMRLHSP